MACGIFVLIALSPILLFYVVMSETLAQHARLIFDAALRAASAHNAVMQNLHITGNNLHVGETKVDLHRYNKIIVIGGGKAGAAMGAAVEQVLGKRITKGCLVVKYHHVESLQYISLYEAAHPVPDASGEAAGKALTQLVGDNAAEDTLFICLISGGASALLVAPAEGISLEDKQEVTSLLLSSGADIVEINTIRKHLSRLKGGQLARLASPARLISLIVSDVVGDRLDSIGSGPTCVDQTTWQDCLNILEKYQLVEKVPESVIHRFQHGVLGLLTDTPKSDDPSIDRVSNYIIASNSQALEAAADKASELGYKPLILSSSIEGETRDVGFFHGAICQEIVEHSRPIPAPCCIISGGETTVTLSQPHGVGGRNLEFVLAAALKIYGLDNLVILSAGTDGTDGMSEAAGAIVDGSTVERAKQISLDPFRFLASHDSHTFFKELDDLIITGPTGTNVLDIHLILAGPPLAQ